MQGLLNKNVGQFLAACISMKHLISNDSLVARMFAFITKRPGNILLSLLNSYSVYMLLV